LRGVDALRGAAGLEEEELGVFRYTAEGWQISSLDEAADARYRDYQQDQTPAADHAAAARAVVCLSFTSSE
jgi:hypothetical protein